MSYDDFLFVARVAAAIVTSPVVVLLVVLALKLSRAVGEVGLVNDLA
jgi:hypothetical protein